MLWTDDQFITINDMVRLDSEVQAVSEAEEITLPGDNGLLRGAYEEITDELQKMMIAFGGYLGLGDLSPNHLSAVMNTGIGNSVRQKALPSQVVVSGDVTGSWSTAKRWAVYWALELFYRDAFNRTVKDRYEGKMRYYKSERQRRVEPMFKGRGVPIVVQPLQRPAALFEPNTGTWTSANLAQVDSAGAVGGTFDVAITWRSSNPTYTSNLDNPWAESHPSDVLTVTVAANKALSVDILTLFPPIGKQPRSQVFLCVIQPLAATHWNVYVGNHGGPLYLQNLAPIPIATTQYDLESDPVLAGVVAGLGQSVNRYLTLVPNRQRA